MQLYYTKSSPYANCVRMVITEIGIDSQVNFIESHPFDNDKAFVSASPLGKVPCLVDSGEVIADSEVICDYLDATYTGGTLFNNIYADWRLKSLYSITSGLMDAAVARRIEITRKQQNCYSEFWWQRHSDAISRTLSYIEEKLALLPEEFSILHINLLSGLAYLDFRHADIQWRDNHVSLAEFYQQHSQRTCFSANSLTG